MSVGSLAGWVLGTLFGILYKGWDTLKCLILFYLLFVDKKKSLTVTFTNSKREKVFGHLMISTKVNLVRRVVVVESILYCLCGIKRSQLIICFLDVELSG